MIDGLNIDNDERPVTPILKRQMPHRHLSLVIYIPEDNLINHPKGVVNQIERSIFCAKSDRH